ncbi:MAG: hypothetical protein V5789_05345 [Colwellia sp.]
MIDNNKLSREVEEQIQSLASDVYMQVEEKLTYLITQEIKAEMSESRVQQSKSLSEKEQVLQEDFAKQQLRQENEIKQLKQALAEKEVDEETAKQNFQVEITQQTINYNETIEALEKKLSNLEQITSNKNNEKHSNEQKLAESLLAVEQQLNDKSNEVDGLNSRIMVLTEQEQSLTKQLVAANENTQLSQRQQNEAMIAVKAQAEAQQGNVSKIAEFEQKVPQLKEQFAIEKQQLIDQIKSMREGIEQLEQQYLDEIKMLNEAGEQAKILQVSAQQAIIELEKTKEQLHHKIETEQKDVKLYQQQVTELTEQVKVAQEEQDNILQRLNNTRDKQEIENNKVRETIKFLRDENHQLINETTDQKADYIEQLNVIEHKLTEYRLKFEYAQKQLAN